MKKIALICIGILVGISGTLVYISKQTRGEAVIIGPERIGKIVGCIDRTHVLISDDGDTIPDIIAVTDDQCTSDIFYHIKNNALKNIEVTVQSLNGLNYRITKYTYLDSKIELRPFIPRSLLTGNNKLFSIDDFANNNAVEYSISKGKY